MTLILSFGRLKSHLSVVGGVLLAPSYSCKASWSGGVVEDSYSYHGRQKHCDRILIWIIYSQQPTSLTYFLRVLHQLPPPPQIESAVNNQSLISYPNRTVVPVASKRPVTLSKFKKMHSVHTQESENLSSYRLLNAYKNKKISYIPPKYMAQTKHS